jgi:hypothetical protein
MSDLHTANAQIALDIEPKWLAESSKSGAGNVRKRTWLSIGEQHNFPFELKVVLFA